MLISIFENYRGVAYFIDSDNFLIYRRLKKGELKIVNPNKSKIWLYCFTVYVL